MDSAQKIRKEGFYKDLQLTSHVRGIIASVVKSAESCSHGESGRVDFKVDPIVECSTEALVERWKLSRSDMLDVEAQLSPYDEFAIRCERKVVKGRGSCSTAYEKSRRKVLKDLTAK